MTSEVSAGDDATDDAPHRLEALNLALVELERRLRHFRLRQLEFTGDLTLYGFLRGVWEHASAARFLARDTDFGVAAYPCVRAAFEAAQDALLLVTEPDYSEAGARARVFERLEHADLKVEVFEAFAGDDDEEPPRDYSEAARSIRADAGKWDKSCPCRGALLVSALDQLQPKFEAARAGKGRHPGHWSGMSRRKMAFLLGERLGEPEFTKSLIATYAQLSRASHPRYRVESWQKQATETGAKRYQRHPREVLIVLGVARLAAETATMAFDRIKSKELPASV